MENKDIVVTTFYHFIDLPNYEAMKDPLLEFCKKHDLKGTILLAKEGINSTISGKKEDIEAFQAHITKDLNIPVNNFKESYSDFKPFLKMKVRLKKEIVAMGVYNLDTTKYVGEYLESDQWDEMLNDKNTIIVDTRNRYEVDLGTFKNAINPKTKNFRETPQWMEANLKGAEDKNILMFCTGGVRCEKSTAYLKRAGFKKVYHLKGGILKYLEDTQNAKQNWVGNCFVFDDRVAVDSLLNQTDDLICYKCSLPVTTDEVKRYSENRKLICEKCAKNLGD